jgi:serine/threonine-protein kinase
LRRSVRPNVAAALSKALEKLPADRFESAKDFSAALVNPSFGAGARPTGLGQASARARFTLRVRTVALIAVAALMLGVAGTKVLWRTGADAGPTTRLMLAFPANQQPRYSSAGTYPVVTQARDGSGLYYWGPGTTTRAQLLFRPWDRLSATRLAHTIGEGCCIVLSPNGDSLAYLIGPHALLVAPVSGGIPRTVADSGLSSVTDVGGGVDWADDGWLYASGLGGLIRVSPQGGRPELVARLDTVRGDLRYLWPAVLPGSNAALVTVTPATEPDDPTRAAIGVADFTTGKVDILLQGVRAIYAPTGHLIVAKPDGILWAVPFDPRSRRVTGRARELPDTASGIVQNMDMSLSPSGTLTYTRSMVETYQAVWVNRSGEADPVAADLSGADVSDPALSPDGRYLALTIAGPDLKYDIWVKSLDGAPKARLTFDAATDQRPAWRPGTGAVSFNSSRANPGGNLLLYERNVDGSGGTRKLDMGDPRTIGGATWSPDGKWLVIRTNDQEAGNADILAIRPGLDSVARPLVASPAEELAPAVSPDGRWIAYSSNESGRREVYVRPFPETGSAQYQVSVDGGTVPLWSHDGRELFFIDAATNMVSVPVIPGPGFQHGQPQILFSAASFQLSAFFHPYDVTPDGKRFVMVRAESDATVHVVVVFNFLAELKRLMAGQ